MRNFAFLRAATIAASLLAGLGGVGTAFADTMAGSTQQVQQPKNASPYDNPNFILDNSNIHG